MGRSSGGRALVALLAVMLLATACGTRLSEEQQALARGEGGASGFEDGPTDLVAGPAEETTDATTATDDPTTGPGGDEGPGGDAPRPQGPVGPETGPSCKGSTASDVGITPTEVRIGNIATIGGPVPGFGQTGRNGLRAFIAYINSRGGVCGRKLVMVPGDDRLEAGVNKSETQRLMEQVFAFVSNTSVADDGGATVLAGTDIASVGLSTTPQAARLENAFSPSPLDPDGESNGAGAIIAYFKEKYSLRRAAVVWPAAPVARSAGERYMDDLAANGIDVVVRREVAITETNYSGVAADIANNEVDIVITVLEFNGIARLARALQSEGYQPKVPFYGAQTYGKKFLQVAGSAAEGVKLGLTYEVFESRARVPEMDLFLDWYERVNPGADIDFFSIMAWVSARMFVDALTAAGAEPTRDELLAKLRGFTDVTANDMLGHINPAGKVPARCFLVVEVKGGRWVKTDPTGPGFRCP